MESVKLNPRVRSIFDYDRDPGIDFSDDPGHTKQSFREETDINAIVERANRTGQLPQMIASDPMYGDFSSVPDYQTALNLVVKAEEQFMGLSAHVRDRFYNDPARFLEFMGDPNNAAEIVKLGLATARGDARPEDRGVPQGGAGQAVPGATQSTPAPTTGGNSGG